MDRSGESRAVVVGGGIGGLLAARVLAECHLEVRVLDRDGLQPALQPGLGPTGASPPHSAPRRGVPQGRHIHTLLPRGRQLLEELFPGLTAQLIDAGAPYGDHLGDARLHIGGHRFARADAGLKTVSVSRPYLEACLRERVEELPNVAIGPPTDVLGLVAAPGGQRVRGVRVLRRADGSAEELLEAALVIDAMGRASRTPAWLQELGYAQPPQERIAGDLGYATRHYRLHPGVLGGDWGTIQGPTPDCPRGGALARIEGDRWVVTLFGLLGEHPPTDPDVFVGFAGSLPFPGLAQAIRTGEPLDDPIASRFPASVRHRYERLRRFPVGLLPIGDAVCSLNPIYGQGMTVAALQARALREHVRRHGTTEPRRWLRRAAQLVDAPWDMAVGGDLAFPAIEGQRTAKSRLLGAYIARLHAGAAHDPRLASAFVRVMAMVDPPTSLVRPGTAVRVLRASRSASSRAGGARSRVPIDPDIPGPDPYEEVRR